jgi:hypothetical protein
MTQLDTRMGDAQALLRDFVMMMGEFRASAARQGASRQRRRRGRVEHRGRVGDDADRVGGRVRSGEEGGDDGGGGGASAARPTTSKSAKSVAFRLDDDDDDDDDGGHGEGRTKKNNNKDGNHASGKSPDLADRVLIEAGIDPNITSMTSSPRGGTAADDDTAFPAVAEASRVMRRMDRRADRLSDLVSSAWSELHSAAIEAGLSDIVSSWAFTSGRVMSARGSRAASRASSRSSRRPGSSWSGKSGGGDDHHDGHRRRRRGGGGGDGRERGNGDGRERGRGRGGDTDPHRRGQRGADAARASSSRSWSEGDYDYYTSSSARSYPGSPGPMRRKSQSRQRQRSGRHGPGDGYANGDDDDNDGDDAADDDLLDGGGLVISGRGKRRVQSAAAGPHGSTRTLGDDDPRWLLGANQQHVAGGKGGKGGKGGRGGKGSDDFDFESYAAEMERLERESDAANPHQLLPPPQHEQGQRSGASSLRGSRRGSAATSTGYGEPGTAHGDAHDPRVRLAAGTSKYARAYKGDALYDGIAVVTDDLYDFEVEALERQRAEYLERREMEGKNRRAVAKLGTALVANVTANTEIGELPPGVAGPQPRSMYVMQQRADAAAAAANSSASISGSLAAAGSPGSEVLNGSGSGSALIGPGGGSGSALSGGPAWAMVHGSSGSTASQGSDTAVRVKDIGSEALMPNQPHLSSLDDQARSWRMLLEQRSERAKIAEYVARRIQKERETREARERSNAAKAAAQLAMAGGASAAGSASSPATSSTASPAVSMADVTPFGAGPHAGHHPGEEPGSSRTGAGGGFAAGFAEFKAGGIAQTTFTPAANGRPAVVQFGLDALPAPIQRRSLAGRSGNGSSPGTPQQQHQQQHQQLGPNETWSPGAGISPRRGGGGDNSPHPPNIPRVASLASNKERLGGIGSPRGSPRPRPVPRYNSAAAEEPAPQPVILGSSDPLRRAFEAKARALLPPVVSGNRGADAEADFLEGLANQIGIVRRF